MSMNHDRLAFRALDRILTDVRAASTSWAGALGLTANTTLCQATFDWPVPDGSLQDLTTNSSLAVEFKPPGHGKSEYVRGLGQAVTYTLHFNYAALIVPELSDDGTRIADYLRAVLDQVASAAQPILLFSYDTSPDNLQLLRPPTSRQGTLPGVPGSERKVFWGYWRDLSQYDLFALIQLMDKHSATFDRVYPRYWKQVRMTGKARTWEGTPRKVATRPKSSADKTNDKQSLRHAGLIDSAGKLTASGQQLLALGKVYGPGSDVFVARLARHVLRYGRHLQLIFFVEEQQQSLPASALGDRDQFVAQLDLALVAAGAIPKSPVNRTFLRDEFKLWNKLGFLKPATAGQYFFPGVGFRFDWGRLISCLSGE